MTPLFKKLNFKAQKKIYVLNAPAEFKDEVKAMQGETIVQTEIDTDRQIEFAIAFVKTKNDIEKISSLVQEKLKDDWIIWFAYPKKTSKKYKVEINRDNGWESMEKLGFETVRAVSIDDDWSALRFRLSQFVKR